MKKQRILFLGVKEPQYMTIRWTEEEGIQLMGYIREFSSDHANSKSYIFNFLQLVKTLETFLSMIYALICFHVYMLIPQMATQYKKA